MDFYVYVYFVVWLSIFDFVCLSCKSEYFKFIYFNCFLLFVYSATIENGGLIHPDIHNALVAIKADTTGIVPNGTAPSHSGSSGRSTPNNTDSAPGKLFVGGLSWQTSSEKLKEYFGMFGNVTDVLIMKDPVTQVCRFKQFNLKLNANQDN